jgi:DNA invertase Pin-like site-specific DNA recombinase
MNTPAVAYFRTSSAANVGGDKDSLKRQQDAVRTYAATHGLEIVHEYYDAAVSGADPVMERAGFRTMLDYMLGNGARVVLVENASRFARDLAVQLAGHDMLKSKGISLLPVDAPNHFEDETPTATMVRSILGAVSQFEKEALVLKLRKARDRVRSSPKRDGRVHPCEGNPAWIKGVRRSVPAAAVELASAAQARGLSLRQAAAELAVAGFLNANGRPFAAQSIKRMLST